MTPAGSNAGDRASDSTTSTAATLPRDRLWTVHQAAAFLGRSTSWVYKAAERGELPRAKGMAWGLRFIPADLEAYARGDVRPPAAVVAIGTRTGVR